MELSWLDGGTGHLQALASVCVGLPDNAVRIGNVSHRLAVLGEGEKFGRNAAEERRKQVRLRVEADQLAATGGAARKDFVSVLAEFWNTPLDGT